MIQDKYFDKLLVTSILIVFLAMHLFNHSQFAEHSADLALGCLLGLVRGAQKEAP